MYKEPGSEDNPLFVDCVRSKHSSKPALPTSQNAAFVEGRVVEERREGAEPAGCEATEGVISDLSPLEWYGFLNGSQTGYKIVKRLYIK